MKNSLSNIDSEFFIGFYVRPIIKRMAIEADDYAG
jgi:hypothetical protein